MKLTALDALPRDRLEQELLRCCGSKRWAREVAARAPFADKASLFTIADAVWASLDEADWLEALNAHPRIGSKRDVSAQSNETRAWAEGEQSGTARTTSSTLAEIAEENAKYDATFGFVYVVCATGKSAEEMLALCRARLGNDRAAELRVGAEEQRKITRIRLEKLLAEEES